MYKKIILSIAIILAMIGTAMARVTPALIYTDQYGMTAVEWMAIIAGICAVVDNVGRYADKKGQNPDLKYNYAYMNSTPIAIALMCMSVLGMEVVALDLNSIFTAIIIGFGGNIGTKVATRGTR